MAKNNDFHARRHALQNSFEAHYYVHDKINPVKTHSHSFYEIYLFESGDVTYQISDKQYSLIPGDIMLLPPKEPHYPIINSWNAKYARIVLWISERFIQNAKESCNCNFAFPFDMANEHGLHLMRLNSVAQNDIFRIAYEMATREEGTYSQAQNNISLLELLIKLNHIYATYKIPTNGEDPFAEHLIRIIDYIVNNFEYPITLDEIADECYLSKYHMAHEFKRTMKMTIYQYITMRRTYRARQMLLAGIKPHEVAKRCGFSDYSAFYRAFKKEYGKTPKEFVLLD